MKTIRQAAEFLDNLAGELEAWAEALHPRIESAALRRAAADCRRQAGVLRAANESVRTIHRPIGNHCHRLKAVSALLAEGQHGEALARLASAITEFHAEVRPRAA